ncbi:DUF3857 domain-containing protein [Mucilaginibacter mali]|uniref:DUF3857 domain-containing protein n=1 Tax=Mucilaginibacter mali TaxID=2740462 RepID=A0A7D4Q653_9SPHI|nr:DUF3857 domain-containing protein [Mucilaginibacter mali]QKJ32187.1 DUF3857 domain-containing protein [Mucilaginibacter mali]
MKKFFALILISCTTTLGVSAQKSPTGQQLLQPYGKVDMADLQSTSCDFEKDANAMVLFDKADIYYQDNKIYLNRHRRVKIFNDNGKKNANVRIEFIGVFLYQHIDGLQAQTINLVNGKPEITKLDSKSIYLEKTDKLNSAYVFSFPNVKPGSILEFKYVWSTTGGLPAWSFQDFIPTRYSVLTTELPPQIVPQIRGGANALNTELISGNPLTGHSALNAIRQSMTNVPSLVEEPYMTSVKDNIHSIYFRFADPNYAGDQFGNEKQWNKIAEDLDNDDDFGHQLNRKLNGEEAILSEAGKLKAPGDKIAYIFNQVRDAMKWNDADAWYTNDGTVKAWEKKTGNATEINLVLYHLLTKAGIKAAPMVVSTRNNGRVFGGYPTLNQFNRTVVSVSEPGSYILDASGKFNIYNETPENLLNNYALLTDIPNKKAVLMQIERKDPVREIIVISGDIKNDGKMAGSAQLTNFSYNRINAIKKYKTDGEQKYIDYLRDNNNNLKISGLKMANMEVDSLPLEQSMDFKLDLAGSDGNYIYFIPAMFNPLKNNPFIKETRLTDIDFGYLDNVSIVGNYKMPDGYKADALPKNIILQTPDQSITFKRIIGEQEGTLVVRLVVSHKQTTYTRDNYDQLFDFYKKLHELMNEQIVLKKS